MVVAFAASPFEEIALSAFLFSAFHGLRAHRVLLAADSELRAIQAQEEIQARIAESSRSRCVTNPVPIDPPRQVHHCREGEKQPDRSHQERVVLETQKGE